MPDEADLSETWLRMLCNQYAAAVQRDADVQEGRAVERFWGGDPEVYEWRRAWVERG